MVSSTLRLVAKLNDLREGLGQLVVVDGHEVALFRSGDQVLAVAARCPHAGGPLQDGMLCGEAVVCPLHLRGVDLRSGEVEDWPDRVQTYPVVVDDGTVLVQLS